MGQILVGGATAQIPSLWNAFFIGGLLAKKYYKKLRALALHATVLSVYGSTELQRAISNTVNAFPITQVSRIVIAAAFHPPAAIGQPLGVAQVTGHPPLTLNEWNGALEMYGYRVPMVSYQEWCTRVKGYASDDAKEEYALLPLFHLVVGDLPLNIIGPKLDDINTAAALSLYDKGAGSQGGPLAWDSATVQIPGMYLAYLVAVGFLHGPAKKGACGLPKLGRAMLRTLARSHFAGRSARP